jgi:hypothetical protein
MGVSLYIDDAKGLFMICHSSRQFRPADRLIDVPGPFQPMSFYPSKQMLLWGNDFLRLPSCGAKSLDRLV